jgi:hypothetical protein
MPQIEIWVLHRENHSNSASVQQKFSKNFRAPSQVPQIYYTVVG